MLFAGRRRCPQDTARLTGGQAAEARQFAQFTIAVRREIRFVDDFQLHPEIVMRHVSFSECSSEISGFPISYFAGALAASSSGASGFRPENRANTSPVLPVLSSTTPTSTTVPMPVVPSIASKTLNP